MRIPSKYYHTDHLLSNKSYVHPLIVAYKSPLFGDSPGWARDQGCANSENKASIPLVVVVVKLTSFGNDDEYKFWNNYGIFLLNSGYLKLIIERNLAQLLLQRLPLSKKAHRQDCDYTKTKPMRKEIMDHCVGSTLH